MMSFKIDNQDSFTITSNFEAPVKFTEEIKYYIKRVLVDILIGLPVLLILFLMYPFKRVIKKRSKRKIILGTVPIIIFKTYNDVLKDKFDTTLFVTKDWSEGSFHNGITLEDISPKFISKSPFFLGSYYSFFWAILNFELFFLYFNSGFLERTIWWRLEPLIYQLFDKKVILFPYGSDVWSVNQVQNINKKYGLTLFDKKYFSMDFKRIYRNHWWSKYVNVVFSLVDFVKFLPRFDILTLHGHILIDIEDRVVLNKTVQDKIKIVHFANDEYRKGTKVIDSILKSLKEKRDDFEYEIIVNVSRDKVLEKIDSSDIVIDTFIDGFLQYTTLEAAAKGKVVFAHLDKELNDFFKYVNNEYYENHFNEIPIIDYNMNTFEKNLIKLLENKDEIKVIGDKTYDFAVNIIKENRRFIIDLTNKLLEKRY